MYAVFLYLWQENVLEEVHFVRSFENAQKIARGHFQEWVNFAEDYRLEPQLYGCDNWDEVFNKHMKEGSNTWFCEIRKIEFEDGNGD